MLALKAKDLHFSYGDKAILKGFECRVEKGERLTFLGTSGCGKTSFLRLCAGLEKPDQGSIFLRGKLVSDESTFLPPGDRGVGYVFQHFALFDKISVEQNIHYGCKTMEHKHHAKELIELLKLESHLHKKPYQLSGGERQKVALARSLCLRPDLLFLDEPFSSIDPRQTSYLIDEMLGLFEKLGVTVVMVTHSLSEAKQFASRVEQFNGQPE